MRIFLQGVSLGILFATGVFSYVIYTSPSPSVEVETEKMTIKKATLFLENQGLLVEKKKMGKPEEEKTGDNKVIEDKDAVPSPVTKRESPDKEVEERKYQLEIKKDMFSQDVTELLYENEIINNKEDFEKFLGRHEHARSIQYGTYNLNDQMTFEEIAGIITTK